MSNIFCKNLEFASKGKLIITPEYLQVGDRPLSSRNSSQALVAEASQLILAQTELVETDSCLHEERKTEKSILRLRHIDLMNAMQERQELVTGEYQQLTVGLHQRDIFGYRSGRVTRSSMTPHSFKRQEWDVIDEFSFYLSLCSRIQLSRWSKRGSKAWWGRYSIKYRQTDDIEGYEDNSY